MRSLLRQGSILNLNAPKGLSIPLKFLAILLFTLIGPIMKNIPPRELDTTPNGDLKLNRH